MLHHVFGLSADPSAHIHITISSARARRIYGKANPCLLGAAIATAPARHIERHRANIADPQEFDVAAFFDDFARDFVTENQPGRCSRATAHHVLIAAANIGRHNFEDDRMFGFPFFVGVDQFGIRNALYFDFAWPDVGHAAIVCHSFLSP